MTCCSFLSPSAILDFLNEPQPQDAAPTAAGESKRKGQQEQLAGSDQATSSKTKKEPDMVSSSKSHCTIYGSMDKINLAACVEL